VRAPVTGRGGDLAVVAPAAQTGRQWR